MKALLRRIAAAAALMAMPLAAEEQHPVQQPAAPPPRQIAPATSDASAAMLAAIDDNMEHMRKQMEQIRQSRDDAERARLVQDHLWLMTWQMEMIKRLRGLELRQAEGSSRDSGAAPRG